MSTARSKVLRVPRTLRHVLEDERKMKARFRELTEQVAAFIAWTDHEMKKPSSEWRGRRVGTAIGSLEFANDSAQRFGLGLSFRQVANMKRRMAVDHARTVKALSEDGIIK